MPRIPGRRSAAPRQGALPEETPEGAVTELRVHGVSGTPPESMLQDPWTVRAAGDGLAGFYRRGQATVSPLLPGPTVPEAFSWGSLTSGASARALWLLLLPFTLVNVSYWMRPRRTGRLDHLTRWLLRMLAVSLTGTLVLAAVGVSVDLVGWQCTAPGQRCGANRSWLRWLTAGFWGEPGRRLLVAAAVPAAVIWLLWYLGRRTWSSYEATLPAGHAEQPDVPMSDPTFWSGRQLVRRLRGIHIAVAVSTLAASLVWPALSADRLSGRAGVAVAGWVLLGAVAALVVLCAGLLGLRRVIDRGTPEKDWLSRLATLAEPASLLLAVLAAVYLALPDRARWPSSVALPGYAAAVTGLFTGQVVVLLLVAAAVWMQRRGVPAGTALGGFAAPVVASIGLLAACGFSAGLSFRVADFLDGSNTQNRATTVAVAPLQPPPQYSWASLGFLLALGGLAVLAVAVPAARLRGKALTRAERRYVAELRAAEPGVNPYRDDRSRLRRVARTRQAAALTDSAPTLVALLVVPGAAITVLMTAAVLLTSDPPAVLAQRHASWLAPATSLLTNLGTWLVGASALALVVLGRAAYRTPNLRRMVGILWDVGTFWPRAAHPLAPPCYAERAVPDLVRRTEWLATPGAGRGEVLLSAHSQGGVLVAAALLQMSDESLSRTRLLTYGCPLHRLYARWFPAYLPLETLLRLDVCVGRRWLNLFRLTDPIGGPIFPGSEASGVGRRVDRQVPDPEAFGCSPGDTVPPPLRLHSDYWLDRAYAVAVGGLVESRPAAPPTPPVTPPVTPQVRPPVTPPAGAEPPVRAVPAASPAAAEVPVPEPPASSAAAEPSVTASPPSARGPAAPVPPPGAAGPVTAVHPPQPADPASG